MRISLQVAGLEDDMPYGMPVGADEPAAMIIEGEAELAASAGQLECESHGVEPRIARRERDGRAVWMIRGGHATASQAAREIHPVVDPERRVTESNLGRS
jgi:hypothetical protein